MQGTKNVTRFVIALAFGIGKEEGRNGMSWLGRKTARTGSDGHVVLPWLLLSA